MPFEFKVNFVDVTRDSSQGLLGNRGPLDDGLTLQSYAIGDELKVQALRDNSVAQFSGQEGGGAQPQVNAVFLGSDFGRSVRAKRDVAPHSTERPLWRGNNAWVLQKISAQEQEHLIRQELEDVAFSNNTLEEGLELGAPLTIKVFDSQASKEEVATTISVIAKINQEAIDPRNKVAVEYAIPYSNGEHHNPNPYSDDYYQRKVKEAIAVFKENQANIPSNLFRISLKDMVGELDANSATRLTKMMITECRNAGVELEFGLHLHNAGLAVDAYVAAIEVCQKENWPLSVDHVEGKEANFALDGSEEEVGHGFASAIDINKKLKERGNFRGKLLTNDQIKALEQKGLLTDQLLEKYILRRAKIAPDLYPVVRECHLAGGAFSSFRQAVSDQNMANALGLSSSEDAARVATYALNVAGYLMGQPFSVTPAMQHRQSGALHILSNMIKEGFFVDCNGNAQNMIDKLKSYSKHNANGQYSLTDAEVQKYFLAGIDGNAAMKNAMNFLADGTVPGDIHPLIQKTLNQMVVPQAPNRIPQIKERLEKLWNDNEIGPDLYQIKRVLNQNLKDANLVNKVWTLFQQNGSDVSRGIGVKWNPSLSEILATSGLDKKVTNKIIEELKEITIRSVTAVAIVAGPDVCYNHIAKPWSHEPDASEFKTKVSYDRAIAKYKKGLNPDPKSDPTEAILEELQRIGNTQLAKASLDLIKSQERLEIGKFVNNFVSKNKELVALFASNMEANEDLLDDLTKRIFAAQTGIITKKLSDKGERFVLSKDERIKLVLETFSASIAKVNNQINENNLLEKMQKIVLEEQSRQVTSVMPANIIEVCVKTGDVVKKGDLLFRTSAMKMELAVNASRSGVVGDIAVKVGSNVTVGGILLSFAASQVEERKDQNSDARKAQVSAQEITKVEQLVSDSLEVLASINEVEKEKFNAQIKSSQVVQLNQVESRASGYNVNVNLSDIKNGQSLQNNTIHVIINRAGCAAKIAGDLANYGCKDIRFFHVKDDENLPILQTTPESQKTVISKYMNQDEIIEQLLKIQKANPDKKIACHPGWGMLSEVAQFSQKCEDVGIVFAGPPAKPMDLAGGKKTFRDLVSKASPHFNPAYLGSATNVKLAELVAYQSNIKTNSGSEIDVIYREEFRRVMEEQEGDCVLKAVAGGGGKGIEFFKANNQLTNEKNYQEYLKLLVKNRQYAAKNYTTDEMLIEQCIRGNAQHVEVQMAADGKGGAAIVGLRNCMIQTYGQKFAEMNIIEGDYPPAVIARINKASQEMSEVLSKTGYRGVGTLEMMLIPGQELDGSDTVVKFLELNTRIQVEHAVTEKDAFNKTGKPLSLPLLNTILTCEDRNIDNVLADDFGFTSSQRKALEGVGEKRVTHFRINAKTLDLENGGAPTPSSFVDELWDTKVTAQIAQKHNVSIVQGGKGGDFDSQIGAMWGDEANVKKAATELLQYFKVMENINRLGNTTNLNNIIEIYEVMLDARGNIRPDVATSTLDQFLKAKEQDFVGDLSVFSGKQKDGKDKAEPSAVVSSASAFQTQSKERRAGAGM